MKRKKVSTQIIVCLLLFLTPGCATVGRNFPHQAVEQIKTGVTTQAEVRRLFGPPWRTGIENGTKTWTYGSYRYRMFNEPSTSDLVVRFDQQGVVESYSFSTTDSPETNK